MKTTKTFLLKLGTTLVLVLAAAGCSDSGGHGDGGPLPDAGTRDAMMPIPHISGPSIIQNSPNVLAPGASSTPPASSTFMPTPNNPSPTLPVPVNGRVPENNTAQK